MTDQLTSKLAIAVREYLSKKGISLYRLSTLTGVSRSHLWKIMQGKVSVSAPVANRIANAIGYNLEIQFTKGEAK